MRGLLEKLLSTLLVVILCYGLFTPVAHAASTMELYTIQAINIKTTDSSELSILNYAGGAYITPETAADLSGMEYAKSGEKHIFQAGYHKVTYNGQAISYKHKDYIRMQDALNQLSCSYAYLSEYKALGYYPTESFAENLFADCKDIYSGGVDFDLRWVKDIPFIGITACYEIIGGSWKIDALWGGTEREQYEKTLWGIMLPTESESEVLSQISKVNSTLKTISTISSYAEEKGKKSGFEPFLQLVSEGVLGSYNTLNEAVPGLGVSDVLGLLENGYAAQYASQLYVNSVKYGLYQHTKIQDVQLSNATKNVYKYYEDNTEVWTSIVSDAAISVVEGGMHDLFKEALKDELGYNSLTVKMVKLLTDKVFGMEKKVGATLALLDCAEIQQEAINQYNNSFSFVSQESNDIDPLQMKYSTLLYLRACQYGYEKFGETGKQGKWANETMQPLIQEKVAVLAVYSDEELTQTTKNENPDFSWGGFLKAETSSTLGIVDTETDLDGDDALSIASELIERYETYRNIGIACDTDLDYNYSQEEFNAIWGLLSKKQQEYLSSPEKSMCCTTYEEAKQQLLNCIDSSLLDYITNDYVIYNNSLYFFMGNKGEIMYRNVALREFTNTKIIALADLYNSGGVYLETHEFTIEKKSANYMITGIDENTTSNNEENIDGFEFTSVMGTSFYVPQGFINVGSEHEINGYYYDFINFDLDMHISVSEMDFSAIDASIPPSELLQSDYEFYLNWYGEMVTYKNEKNKTISGYYIDENAIFYIRLYDLDSVYTMVEFYYPSANRGICDDLLEDFLSSIRH